MAITMSKSEVWMALHSCTRLPITLLWVLLWWYLYVVLLHFDPSPSIWINATIVCIIVGIALNFNAYHAPYRKYFATNYLAVIRFFIIPFLVASFTATASSVNRAEPNSFLAIFPLEADEAAITFGVGAVLFVLLMTAHKLIETYLLTEEQKEELVTKIGRPQGKDYNRNAFQFFVRWFRPPLAVLWAIFFWYIFVIVQHPPPIRDWLSSFLVSLCLGVALNANIYRPPLKLYLGNQPMKAFRFFIVPFCVASYSSGAGSSDFSFLPPNQTTVALGIASALTFGILCVLFWWKYADRPRRTHVDSKDVNRASSSSDSDGESHDQHDVVYSEHAPMVDTVDHEAQLT